MRLSLPLRVQQTIGLALVALALVACEDSVDPTVGLDIPFSLYGYLDPTTDLQAIRVAPITLSIDTEAATIDAAVTSTDLGTGVETVWRDSLVSFASGETAHVFVADYTPRPGATVRVEARRSDGAVSAVDIAVPAIVQPSVSSPTYADGDIRYSVMFGGAPRVLNGQLRLTVLGLPSVPEGSPGTIVVETTARPREIGPEEWAVDVPFLSATRRALEVAGLLGAGLEVLAVDYVGFVTNEAWALPSEDPDVLVEPGLFSNIESGLGFIGAGYRATARWVPAASVLAAAGFAAEATDDIVLNELGLDLSSGWVELYNPTAGSIDLRGYSLSNDQSDPRKLTLPPGTTVPPGGFLVVPFSFRIELEGYIELFDRRQESVGRIVTEPFSRDWPLGVSFGSYPDGARFRLGQERTDLFQGPLRPTPGAPNVFGLDVAVIHEVFTEGSQGFVEVATLDPFVVDGDPVVFSDLEGYYDGVSAGTLAFGVAPERPGALDLFQTGGEVYLAVRYIEHRLRYLTPGKPPSGGQPIRTERVRVVDVRRYGPQTPGRSVGYLPDPGGAWTPDLRPTPGAPNASARWGM